MTISEAESADFTVIWGGVLTRFQTDDDFAARLFADPRLVLSEAGIALRPGAQVRLETVDPASAPSLDRQLELYAAGRAGGAYTFLVPESRIEVQEIAEGELDGVAAAACIAAFVVPPAPAG